MLVKLENRDMQSQQSAHNAGEPTAQVILRSLSTGVSQPEYRQQAEKRRRRRRRNENAKWLRISGIKRHERL